jgi:glycosyltransferase involved in cell wall biosynthesis
LVALEAGAGGVPVVATRTGGLVDLLAGGRGLLVDQGDIPALVAAVRSCLDDPDAAAERAERLRAHVRHEHGAEVVGPRWLDAVLGR